MGAFDHFPYTNFHELNLMWILEALKEIQTTTEQFVAINSLKYADPIQWNIVQQYEKNTIVIDPLTGTAYISVQPVPTGVSISNEDYWTVVFDLGSFVVRAAKNFTSRHEDETTLTATFNTQAGEWLVWGDTLYVANVNITAGDSYVVDSNITHITIEEIKNEIYTTFNGIIGDLADLDTTDKSSIVAAINEILQTLISYTNAVGRRVDLTQEMITVHIEARGSTTASFNMLNNDWLILDNVLYEAQTNISIGDSYVVGSNIIQKSVEDFFDELVLNINNLRNYVDTQDAGLRTYINSQDEIYYSKIRVNSRAYADRTALFIGDSYGDPAVIGAATFPDLVGQSIGFREYHNLCVSGASFYNPSDNLKYVAQIINYTGDRDAVTDIFIIAGLNDSKSTNPGDAFYTSTINEMDTFNTYVINNYPNAHVTFGYIGNMRDSYVLSVNPSDPRVYLARKCAMQVLFEHATSIKWSILHDCETILSQYEGYIGNDGIHPTAIGEIELGKGIINSLYNGTPMTYIYDFPCIIAYDMAINSGQMLFTMFNREATLRENGIQLNASGKTINQNFTALYLTRNWFNVPVCVSSYIRFYGTQIGDVVLPATYVFTENTLKVNALGIFNSGQPGSTYVTQYTFGEGGFIEIPAMTVTFDSTMLA